jgi:thiamine-monophosphate kinase
LGIGDDCALLTIPEGCELAITTDTMVENVHFFSDVNPEWLGYKLLAVNLSDLASMGAKPVAVTLALTLPEVNEAWISAFSKGFLRLAKQYSVDLIGGDTTAGPLTLTVQAMGLVPKGEALKRSAARPGDLIYLTGNLGDAGLGLKILQGYDPECSENALNRFYKPSPRVSAGLFLRPIAHACIDLSDGLVSDLGHILAASNVGAFIEWKSLPLSSAVTKYIEKTGDWEMPLVAGDDYELCFTADPEMAVQIEDGLDNLNCSCRTIGEIEAEQGLRLSKNRKIEELTIKGYEHFS